MRVDPVLPLAVLTLLGILALGLLFQRLRQPHVIGYLVVGVLLGPHGIDLIKDADDLDRLGAIGVLFLMFFVGMEVSPRKLALSWKISIIGTSCQIAISVLAAWLIGLWLDWPVERSILIGFVISLSSTAVVLRLLQDWGELRSHAGQNVLGILLFQDIAIVPMLIMIGLLTGDEPSLTFVSMQGVGALVIGALLFLVLSGRSIKLPFSRHYRRNHELQIFAALIICLGLASLTGLLGLSTALGAFVAGMLVAGARETRWVHHSMEPFRIVFTALFFVSVGMLVDLHFVRENWRQIASLVLAVFMTNTFINAVVLRILGETWRESLYASALLAQIGEFSFVLALVGYRASIISEYGYDLTIAIIAATLLLSPPWIALAKRVTWSPRPGMASRSPPS